MISGWAINVWQISYRLLLCLRSVEVLSILERSSFEINYWISIEGGENAVITAIISIAKTLLQHLKVLCQGMTYIDSLKFHKPSREVLAKIAKLSNSVQPFFDVYRISMMDAWNFPEHVTQIYGDIIFKIWNMLLSERESLKSLLMINRLTFNSWRRW